MTMLLAQRVKKLKNGLKAHHFDETADHNEKVTRTIVEHEGRRVAEYVKHGDQVVSHSSTPDAREAGVEMGGKKNVIPTSPMQAAEQMEDKNIVQDKADIPENEKVQMLKKTEQPTGFEQILPRLRSLKQKMLQKGCHQ